MISLYQDPAGKDVFSKTAPSENNEDYVRSSVSGDVEILRLKVLELERRLSQVCVCAGLASSAQPQKPFTHALY